MDAKKYKMIGLVSELKQPYKIACYKAGKTVVQVTEELVKRFIEEQEGSDDKY